MKNMVNDEEKLINKTEADKEEEIKDKKDLVQTYLIVSTLLLAIKQFTANPEFNIINTQNSTLTTVTYSTSTVSNTFLYASFYLFIISILLYRASLSMQPKSYKYIYSISILAAIGFSGIIYFSIGEILINTITEKSSEMYCNVLKNLIKISSGCLILIITITLDINIQETKLKVISIITNYLNKVSSLYFFIERKMGNPVMIFGAVAFFIIALYLLAH
jgi:hypothetical protein